MSGTRIAGSGSVPLLTAAEVRAWDECAIRAQGVAQHVLMETAGRAAAHVLHRLHPRGRVVGAVGRGNNGGDALVLLRTLQSWGRDVVAVPAGDSALDRALSHGWEIPTASGDLDAVFAGGTVLVDGILGTGSEGAPRQPQASCIEAMNRAGRPIVALDGPSGVDFTTGQIAGAAIAATATVTFGAPKRGLLRYPGRARAGRIVAVEIGLPPLENAGAFVITPAWAQGRVPVVPGDAHKGTQGSVAVIAGSSGVAGAAVLVGTGAARAGAGKVHLVSPAENREILQVALPEALYHSTDAIDLPELLESVDAAVVGPGIGTGDSAGALLDAALKHLRSPVVLDADALTLVARDPSLLDGFAGSILMTPHPGEMARLMGTGIAEVVADPFGTVERAVARYRCAVLLKGAPSLVSAPGEPIMANVAGHAGIATGGMGDTLAGVAAAMLGVGCSPRDAGAIALHLTGRAAEIAGRGRSLLPRDVADALGDAITEPLPESALGLPEVTFDLLPPTRV